jgi:hypothetical protein
MDPFSEVQWSELTRCVLTAMPNPFFSIKRSVAEIKRRGLTEEKLD